ncbi:acyltransferase [Calothrix sp. FACHB-1219]|uniref:acyltransferase family protein n=1 Tax=unclassified Calothrix TaxID=2619626 RepID=UPI001685C01F|nr:MULTISPECIES: acyltransferase [unclassified Calothrix]MBD2203641.1 acyltransferase [Calothrix sp. FACHB-168]MBD2219947.1 acyltransferase [Calothrix sp. FACHB-1219]
MENKIENKSDNQRDIRFDILKSIGLICIIYAHIGSENNIFFHIRRFDVPLMVIVSGALYYYSASKKQISFRSYLEKRLPRLIAPVWLFLTFFFVSAYGIFTLLSQPYPFAQEKIFETFILSVGIGYVWIIRVFILVAIFSSLLMNIYIYCRTEFIFLAGLSLTYILYEILLKLVSRVNLHSQFIAGFINDYLFYLLPYGCLFGLGMTLPKLKKRIILVTIGIFLGIFLGLAVYYYYQKGHFVSTSEFKYPARLYYISYGIIMSLLGFLLVDKLVVKYKLLTTNNCFFKTIVFISSSSLWIYLWHIFFVYYWQNLLSKNLPEFMNRFNIDFLLVVLGAITVTYLQKKFISSLVIKNRFGQNNLDLLVLLFLK